MGSIIAETFCDFHRSRQKNADNLSTIHVRGDLMSDNDHIDAQWLRAAQSPPPPPRRRSFGCALSLLVLILVLAGVLFYPRVQALLTPVPTVQIQMESSVLPDTAPNCTANPRVAAVLHAAMRGQTDAAVYDCDAGTLEACMAELLDDPAAYDRMAKAVNPYGDGKACPRIAQAILSHFLDAQPPEPFVPAH